MSAASVNAGATHERHRRHDLWRRKWENGRRRFERLTQLARWRREITSSAGSSARRLLRDGLVGKFFVGCTATGWMGGQGFMLERIGRRSPATASVAHGTDGGALMARCCRAGRGARSGEWEADGRCSAAAAFCGGEFAVLVASRF